MALAVEGVLGPEALFEFLKLCFDTGINGTQTGCDETAAAPDAGILPDRERFDIASRVPKFLFDLRRIMKIIGMYAHDYLILLHHLFQGTRERGREYLAML